LAGAAALIFPRLVIGEGGAAAIHFAAGTGAALAALVLAARAGAGEGPPPARAVIAQVAAGTAAVLAGAWAPVGPVFAAMLVDLGLILAAGAVGGAVGRRVAHPGHLMPACAVAAAADLASVIHPSGPSHAIAASERALSLVAFGFPVPGVRAVAPALGVGDLTFLALVLGVVIQHRMSLGRAVVAAVVGLAAAGGVAALAGREVPALVPIGAAVVAFLPEARRVRPEERRTAALAIALSAAVVVGVLLSPR
jgi:hypothetical protein